MGDDLTTRRKLLDDLAIRCEMASLEMLRRLKAVLKQPFRAGDVVEMLVGTRAGERWVIACYNAERDEAWIAGWPETLVDEATRKLRLDRAASDEEHAEMIAAVSAMKEGMRRSALLAIQERGGTP
jgi:hypothetical protein